MPRRETEPSKEMPGVKVPCGCERELRRCPDREGSGDARRRRSSKERSDRSAKPGGLGRRGLPAGRPDGMRDQLLSAVDGTNNHLSKQFPCLFCISWDEKRREGRLMASSRSGVHSRGPCYLTGVAAEKKSTASPGLVDIYKPC